MTEEITTVVCMRVDQPGIYVVPGSVAVNCFECGDRVWVASSTFTIMFGKPHQFMCVRCVPDDAYRQVGEAILRGIEPVQREEIERYRHEIEEHFRG